MAHRVPFDRKRIRLPLERYREPLAISLTTVTANRIKAFADERWGDFCVRMMTHFANEQRLLVYAYCLMPDHLHLVVQNTGDESLIDFVKRFKQRSGYQFKRESGQVLWQRSYYDHFLRSEDDLLVKARYTFANPVRGGLVARAEEYPFSGSLVWDRSVLVEACDESDRSSTSSHRSRRRVV